MPDDDRSHVPVAPIHRPVPRPSTTLRVEGRFLQDRRGHSVVLRGVNLPLIDDWPDGNNPGVAAFPGRSYLDEIVKSGANAIRIEWYKTVPEGRPPYSLVDLGNFLDACIAASIIPIVELHDFTDSGQYDVEQLALQIVPYWTQSTPADPGTDVLGTLVKRQHCLVLNIANELGKYRWSDGSQETLNNYTSAYKDAIVALRKAGLNMPLMIDAPDGGTTLSAFTSTDAGESAGLQLVGADPLRNILLSAHAYWAGWDDTEAIAKAVSQNLPLVFGEVANKQGNEGDTIYDLDGSGENTQPDTSFTYQALLTGLLGQAIGWLAWSWHPDNVDARNMSSDGSFSSLTRYGEDVVNNATYGLKATAKRIVV